MNDQSSAPVATALTVQGITVYVYDRFAEGHKLTALEAEALNQTVRDNLRNNFAGAVKTAKKKHGEDLPAEVAKALQSQFKDYADNYEFKGRKASVPSLDPVEKLARKIALDRVKAKFNEKGIDIKSLAEGKLDEYVTTVLLKYPAITAEAQRRLDATKELATDILEGL